MKPLTEQQLREHAAASRRGALEGVAASGTLGLAASYYAHRNIPAYRRLPISLKALGLIILVAPVLSIQAERRGLEYDRSQWVGEGVRILDEREHQLEKRWQEMSLKAKIGDWMERHEYSIILGGWAGSLGVAGAIISRQKYQTYPQKIVQARMWAQGLTIGILIVAGALKHANRVAATQVESQDHSWRDLLEQQERDRQAEKEEAARDQSPAGRRAYAARYEQS
ncbi:hypothetical protein BDQ12DRAFT_709523 [Crucibulum laeve]|uniref:HIG1 domain-containing protein n=1 Tax=Crucibulum laeve TaxID=68775 RepID=A0A5C3MFY1_9AGAR|nr:hypothetical protein BDQ12DRAFT_709523 [Crucibulum laeve]